MPTVFVHENIARIERAVSKFTDELSMLEKRKEEIKTERTRLEGCLITFEGFARAGIEEIVPEHEKKQYDDGRRVNAGEHNSCSDPRAQMHDQGEHNSGSDPRAQMHDQGEHNSCSDPHAQMHDQGEHNSGSDPRAHMHDQGEHNSGSDPRAHMHDQGEHDKSPLEELYAKYRTM
jgi:hypothetical protein